MRATALQHEVLAAQGIPVQSGRYFIAELECSLMGSRFAAALLVVIGLLHLGTLVALSVTSNTRPLTAGDIAFLTGAGALNLMAAVGVAKQRRWGRRLGLAVSGVEAVPATVLLYTLVVFSADPSNRASLAQLAFMTALLAPLAVFIALWFHKPRDLT